MSAEMLELLGIGADDLAANRAGRLGPNQLRRRRRRALTGAAAFTAVGVLLAIVAAASGAWLVPALCAAAALVFAASIAAQLRSTPAVRCLTGPVTLAFVARGRAGNVLRMTVAGEACLLPQPLRSTEARWRAALSAPVHHVYVTDSVPTVVGVEPA